jgi:hypothetical protein
VLTKEEAQKKVKENIGSLESLCKEAICCADLNLMLAMDFPEEASKKLCEIISLEASDIGIEDLRKHYLRCLKEKKSNIINTIVRRKHKIYFASRSNLHPIRLLEHLRAAPNDICAYMFKTSIGLAETNKVDRRSLLLKKKLASIEFAEANDMMFAAESEEERDDT